jgi:hypothetical protein
MQRNKEVLIISKLPLSLPDKITVAVVRSEFTKAKNEGLIDRESVFFVNKGRNPSIKMVTGEAGLMFSTILTKAFRKLRDLEHKGIDFSESKINENSIKIVKKAKRIQIFPLGLFNKY